MERLLIRLEGMGVNNGEGLYSKKVIADLLNLTERRVEQLTAQRIIPKAERGKYDLGPTIKAYVMYLQQRLSGGKECIDVAALKDEKLKAETEERKAKADMAAMRADAMRGQLIDRDDVVRQWTSRVTEVRAALLGLPQEIGFLFGETEQRIRIEEGVEKFVEETLKRYSREGICTPRGVDAEGTDGAVAAEEDKRERMGGRKQSPRPKKRNARTVEDSEDTLPA